MSPDVIEKQGPIAHEVVPTFTVTMIIRRFDPEVDEEPRWVDYDLQMHGTDRVLDALHKIKWELDGSLAFRRSCGGDDDGCGGGVLRIFRQGTAYIDTGHIRKADIDDDEIGLRCARQLDHLFPRVRAQYGVTVGSENTLERSGRPFLIVGKKYQRWS